MAEIPTASVLGRRAAAAVLIEAPDTQVKKPKTQGLILPKQKLSTQQETFVHSIKNSEAKSRRRHERVEGVMKDEITEKYEGGDETFLMEMSAKITQVLHEFKGNQEEAITRERNNLADLLVLSNDELLKKEQQSVLKRVRKMTDAPALQQMLSFSLLLTSTVIQTQEFRKIDHGFLLRLKETIDEVVKEQEASTPTFLRSTSDGDSQEIGFDLDTY